MSPVDRFNSSANSFHDGISCITLTIFLKFWPDKRKKDSYLGTAASFLGLLAITTSY